MYHAASSAVVPRPEGMVAMKGASQRHVTPLSDGRSGDERALMLERIGLSRSPWQLLRNQSGALAKWVQPAARLPFDAAAHQRPPLTRSTPLSSLTMGDDLLPRQNEPPLEIRLASSDTTIGYSLPQDVQRAGISDEVIVQLDMLLEWDFELARAIRPGDRLHLLYEERYRDGEKIGDGALLAATFVNRGQRRHLIRFTDAEGNTSYYSADGRAVRKPVLRSPMNFRRITSRFHQSRRHPVRGERRPHHGIDFAATIGTPIQAAGGGNVLFLGWLNGYGNTLVLDHGAGYTTLYGHLSHFDGATQPGARVEQGQVVGYVGNSGLATGPHLHYEVRVDGVPHDPLTVKLPVAAPIAPHLRAAFEQQAATLLARLHGREQQGVPQHLAEWRGWEEEHCAERTALLRVTGGDHSQPQLARCKSARRGAPATAAVVRAVSARPSPAPPG
ncbi:MAG TPA: M23 family metallopeptidase [Gammaproteobacteria bacterium]